MKIAVASTGKEPESKVSEVAGRAPYFLVFDEKETIIEIIRNPFAIGGGGAGWSVAKMLADKGASVVVAGRFGDNMLQALGQRGLDHCEFSGTANDSVKYFLNKARES
jgi:predicted Fe-Mo cluster-binding NifX family protein